MSTIIQRLKISQINMGEISISWEVNDPSQDFEFFVDKSGSPEGPFEQVNNISIVHAYGYIDRTFNSESVNRQIYYRVRGVNSKEEIISKVEKLNEAHSNYMGIAIARNKRVVLERLAGSKSYIFIRKSFGKKCEHCYDKARQKVIGSDCIYCYGTTFDGGYFAPILTYLYIDVEQKANSKSDLQNIENLRIDGAWCGNYPLLSPGDLIVKAIDQDVRYIVESPITRTSQNDVVVEQRFSVTMVHASRVEMKVSVPENVYSIDDVNIYRRDYV